MMEKPQRITLLTKAARKPYATGSAICTCFFLFELTAWPNMSPWSWLYLAPYCITLLLLAWFPIPASAGILVTHAACAIIPTICDGPSTLYGAWLACGILAFEIKRFELAITGPLLCALSLPLGYWLGDVDYNPSIPVLACSYIGAFFVGFAVRWKVQTEQRKANLAIAQKQVQHQQKKAQRNSHTARFHRRSYDICDSAVPEGGNLWEQRHFSADRADSHTSITRASHSNHQSNGRGT